ncbi:hypothetical protein ACLKA7_000668 [Drosophila subpalustris]
MFLLDKKFKKALTPFVYICTSPDCVVGIRVTANDPTDSFVLAIFHEGTSSLGGASLESPESLFGSRPYSGGRILATCGALVAGRSILAALALVNRPSNVLPPAFYFCSSGVLELGAMLFEQQAGHLRPGPQRVSALRASLILPGGVSSSLQSVEHGSALRGAGGCPRLSTSPFWGSIQRISVV